MNVRQQTIGRLLVVGIASGVAVIAASPAVIAQPTQVAPAPSAEVVAADVLGVGGDGNLDWRAEQDAAGQTVVYFGPGVVDLPVSATTVKVAASSDAALADSATTKRVSSATTNGLAAAAATWFCQMSTPATPELTGGNLKSFVGVSCYNNRPGSMLLQYKYQRSSWSGMRNYTNLLQTSETTLQALGANTYAACGSGGYYDYNVTAHAVVYNAGAVYGSTYITGSSLSQAPCGTGVS